MKHLFPFLLVILGLTSCNNNLNISIINANVEQQVHPQVLATAQPRFSWQYETTENNVVQQNYRIVVASTAENAQKGIGDLWDSGVTATNQMLYIPYAGKALQSRDKAYWKVIATVTAEGKKIKVENDGTVRNSSGSSIGKAAGIKQEWVAAYFFFFPFY